MQVINLKTNELHIELFFVELIQSQRLYWTSNACHCELYQKVVEYI